jgi:competence protein ComEC
MNTIIDRTARLPFSVTDNIQVGLVQTIILYFSIAYLGWWLLQKKKAGLFFGLGFLLFFFGSRSHTLLLQSDQQKLIVYNIPKQKAIDIMEGNGYQFAGDSSLMAPGFRQSFYLQPSRVLHGAQETVLPSMIITDQVIYGRKRSVLIIDRPMSHFHPAQQKIPVDIIILSGGPRVYISQLYTVFDCRQYVFDSSNPLWKIRYWKKDADSLHLRHHTVSEQGAFEADL